jgi:succinate-semialdehyde dehydrogenase/glutarate-semialdehyde dehydrogenase
MAIATTNPATGEVLKTFEPLTDGQIEQKLQLAASAFQTHRWTSFADRAEQDDARRRYPGKRKR